MIELLLQLIDRGIDLLREEKSERLAFFEEVVEPIHETFLKLYHDHLETFEKTRAMLLNDKIATQEIASFVEGKILFERGTNELLFRLTKRGNGNDWRRVPKRRELNDHFYAYIDRLAQCLISHTRESEPVTSVVYYAALTDIIDMLTAQADHRQRALRDLEGIIGRFQKFYANAANQFIQLRRYCSRS